MELAYPRGMPTKKKSDADEDDQPTVDDASREAPATEEAPDGEVDATAAADDPRPRPWRVETFYSGDQWGWRLCAANGVVVSESQGQFGTKEEAVEAAQGDGQTQGATFHDLDRRTR